MKRRNTMAGLLLILALSICTMGCGSKKEAELPAKDYSEEVDKANQEGKAEYLSLAKEYIEALSQMELMCAGGGLTIDMDQGFELDGQKLYRVTDEKFTSRHDISEYVLKYLSLEAATSRYSGLLETDETLRFMDLQEGNEYNVLPGLYMMEAGRGCYAFETDDVSVTAESDVGFTTESTFDAFGSRGKLVVEFMKDGDHWYIDNFQVITE